MIPESLKVRQFIYIIRNKLKLRSEEALIIYFDKYLVNLEKTIGEVYKNYKDDDGFLYVIFSSENVFG